MKLLYLQLLQFNPNFANPPQKAHPKEKQGNGTVIRLLSTAKIAAHRNYINRSPFFGYKLQRPIFQSRSLTANELDSLISTPIQSSELNFTRDMFVFASFTGISHMPETDNSEYEENAFANKLQNEAKRRNAKIKRKGLKM